MGRPSSHFRCLSLHVRQPVLTRFGLAAGWVSFAVIEVGVVCERLDLDRWTGDSCGMTGVTAIGASEYDSGGVGKADRSSLWDRGTLCDEAARKVASTGVDAATAGRDWEK